MKSTDIYIFASGRPVLQLLWSSLVQNVPALLVQLSLYHPLPILDYILPLKEEFRLNRECFDAHHIRRHNLGC